MRSPSWLPSTDARDDLQQRLHGGPERSADRRSGSRLLPPSTTPLGRAFQDPNALGDPLAAAVTAGANARVSAAYNNLQTTAGKAETAYQKLAALSPDDATLQIQLGQAAQNAGDSATALVAYRRFLKLAPNDPLSPQVSA